MKKKYSPCFIGYDTLNDYHEQVAKKKIVDELEIWLINKEDYIFTGKDFQDKLEELKEKYDVQDNNKD